MLYKLAIYFQKKRLHRDETIQSTPLLAITSLVRLILKQRWRGWVQRQPSDDVSLIGLDAQKDVALQLMLLKNNGWWGCWVFTCARA